VSIFLHHADEDRVITLVQIGDERSLVIDIEGFTIDILAVNQGGKWIMH
jgi:hypothetical protein